MFAKVPNYKLCISEAACFVKGFSTNNLILMFDVSRINKSALKSSLKDFTFLINLFCFLNILTNQILFIFVKLFKVIIYTCVGKERRKVFARLSSDLRCCSWIGTTNGINGAGRMFISQS